MLCSILADEALDISYWKHTVGAAGFMKEVKGAQWTGGVANTGVLRQMTGDEIDQARKDDSTMSSSGNL